VFVRFWLRKETLETHLRGMAPQAVAADATQGTMARQDRYTENDKWDGFWAVGVRNGARGGAGFVEAVG